MVRNLNYYKLFLFSMLAMSSSGTFAQSGHGNLLQGDKYYTVGEYNLAEEEYRKARLEEKDLKSSFNLGNAVYQQERYEEAVDHYTAAAQLAPDNIKRSDAYFNLGNALFKNEKFKEAADAFKEAIQLNQENDEARYNLLVTKQILKQPQQQQEQQDQKEQQDKQDQQDQQDQEQQEQQQQQNQQEQSENQEQQDQQEQQEQQEQQDSTQQDIEPGAGFDTTRLDKQSLDSLDAMKLLQIIQNEEQKVQEKLKKFNSNKKKPEKDW